MMAGIVTSTDILPTIVSRDDQLTACSITISITDTNKHIQSKLLLKLKHRAITLLVYSNRTSILL